MSPVIGENTSKRQEEIMNFFTATIASRGYHVYKNTSWTNARLGEEVSIALETSQASLDVDPYACAVKIKNRFYKNYITVGHLPREISRHVHFFIKTEGGKVHGTVKSLIYRGSPIPAGGLEIPLMLRFENKDKETLDFMHGFVNSLYDWDYDGRANGGDSERNGEGEENAESEDESDFSLAVVAQENTEDARSDDNENSVIVLD